MIHSTAGRSIWHALMADAEHIKPASPDNDNDNDNEISGERRHRDQRQLHHRTTSRRLQAGRP